MNKTTKSKVFNKQSKRDVLGKPIQKLDTDITGTIQKYNLKKTEKFNLQLQFRARMAQSTAILDVSDDSNGKEPQRQAVVKASKGKGIEVCSQIPQIHQFEINEQICNSGCIDFCILNQCSIFDKQLRFYVDWTGTRRCISKRTMEI